MIKKRLHKEFLLLYVPWLIPVIFILSGFYYLEYKGQYGALLYSEQFQTELSKLTLEDKLVERVSDLRVIASLTEQQIHDIDFIPTYALGEIFLTIARNHYEYDQIRMLDTSGKEIVRVNYNKGEPKLVAKEKLQDKQGRYYFTDSMNLEMGTYFVSRLDLNIEQGKIEMPIKPMIRLGVKIEDKRGALAGILLLNYRADDLLSEYARETPSSANRLSIVNTDGYWLKHPNPMREWGFMHQNNERFQNTFPEEWKNIKDQGKGQLKTDRGIFTYGTVYPVPEDGSIAANLTSGKGLRAWKVISHLTPSVIEQNRKQLIQRYIIIALPLVLILALVCWWLAVVRLKHHKANLALIESQKTLEWKVLKRTEALQHEVLERKKIEEKLRHMATYDGLTGIPNRELFMDRLQHAIAISRRHKNDLLALFFIDLDGFKAVNDTYGHEAGDQLLKQVSYRLSHTIRESDTLGRLGGDEFVILLQELGQQKDAIKIANTVLMNLQRDFNLDGVTTNISCSIGIAFFQDGNEAAKSLLARADTAMYLAKDSGKNKLVLAEAYSI